MKPAIAFLRHGSTVEGREVFLVTILGKAFIDLDLDTAVIVPRGNITTTSEQYLLEKTTQLVSAYIFLDEKEAMLFRIKYT
jgi:hypothetical protein